MMAAMRKADIVITRTGPTSKPTCQILGMNVDAHDTNDAYAIAISSFAVLSIQNTFRPYVSSICLAIL